jgi:alpha-beta hydrolase superfamily lysophospholipase
LIRIFIHGLESDNKGIKSIFFREHYPDMIIPHFVGELSERMKKLEEVLASYTDITLVGSSFGGLMASLFTMKNEPRVNKLILLAPAINMMELSDYRLIEISTPVSIYHGTRDDVIHLEAVEPIAKKYFRNLTFNKVEDDHFLRNTFPNIDWKTHFG